MTDRESSGGETVGVIPLGVGTDRQTLDREMTREEDTTMHRGWTKWPIEGWAEDGWNAVVVAGGAVSPSALAARMGMVWNRQWQVCRRPSRS